MSFLGEVYAQIKNHETEQDDLLRLFEKNVSSFVLTPFSKALRSSNLAASKEEWPLQSLMELPSGNVEGNPFSSDEPVVVVEINGYRFLVDGHNRRTKWINEGRENCPVLVVRVKT